MEKKELPKEVSRGKMKIGSLEFEVVVLDNGQRIIEQKDFEKIAEFLNPPQTIN